MKTNKMIAAGLAVSAIVILSMNSVSAMNGQGQGFGKSLTTEQKTELQSMSEIERQEYVKKLKTENGVTSGKSTKGSFVEHNPGDLLSGVVLQDLSDTEKEMLYYGYSEELLAHDMYMYFYDIYGIETFKNIANSELEHMAAVKSLLERYKLDIPTNYGELTDEFNVLKAEGEISLQKALEVGVKIEILDIDDIAETIRTTDNDDLKIIFSNIGGASYNHLRGFLNALTNNGLTTTLDYSNYLTEAELATKGGGLKSKMAEKLEAEGEILPEQAKSQTIKANCDKETSYKGEGSKGDKKGNINESKGKSESSNRNNSNANANKYANNSILKAKYKSTYEVKYGSVISKMDDSDLDVFISKIDDVLEKVQIGNYSDAVKQKYNAMLLALKDIALDNVDDENILDGLFN